MGDVEKAISEARWTFNTSARLGDSRTFCTSLLLARATNGDFPYEELSGCFPNRPDDVMSTANGGMAEGVWHSFHGRSGEALETFERVSKAIWKTLCLNSHTLMVLPHLSSALLDRAEAIQSEDPKRSKRLIRRADRVSKWATRILRFLPVTYPFALRERSRVLVTRGKLKKALKFAERSCEVAEKQKARFEHLKSLVVRAQIRCQLGHPDAETDLQSTEDELDRFYTRAKAAIQSNV